MSNLVDKLIDSLGIKDFEVENIFVEYGLDTYSFS